LPDEKIAMQLMPAIDDVLAIAAAAFAIAAWVVPPARYLLSFRKKPRDSLAVVGRVIGMFVLSGLLSTVALVLALLTLAFSRHSAWGWFSLAAVGAYWISLAIAVAVSRLFWRHRQRGGRGG
jgi:uncharacterized membrane protein YbhN (UPF0104 family)